MLFRIPSASARTFLRPNSAEWSGVLPNLIEEPSSIPTESTRPMDMEPREWNHRGAKCKYCQSDVQLLLAVCTACVVLLLDFRYYIALILLVYIEVDKYVVEQWQPSPVCEGSLLNPSEWLENYYSFRHTTLVLSSSTSACFVYHICKMLLHKNYVSTGPSIPTFRHDVT